MKKIIIIPFFLPIILTAQFISVKSIPVSTGDQFLLFPSQNLSIGGVNIALNDNWLDPISNPAKGSRLHETSIFLQPTFYNVTGNLGSGWTLPTTAFIKANDWFGVISLAFQRLQEASLERRFNPWLGANSIDKALKRGGGFNSNNYTFISVGKKLSSSGWAVGGSYFKADLDAVTGVDLLYNDSKSIEQNGDIHELKAGVTYESDFSTFETMLLFSNYEMLHEVYYEDWFWDERNGQHVQMDRIEKNLDYTNTYGIHIAYKEKHDEKNLVLGAITTFNWKTHPKIPNYDLMKIPRDPGNTWAFNFGVGLGSIDGKTDIPLGIDFIYEPIWSNTWANAEEEIITNDNRKILPGQKTIENDFTFSNWLLRFGISKLYDSFILSAGVEFYSRNYTLNQYDYIASSNRTQEESWIETTLSWGLKMNFKYFNLKYSGRLISGNGMPSIDGGFFEFGDTRVAALSSDIIAAPAGSLNVSEQITYTHQFIIQVPLGSQR